MSAWKLSDWNTLVDDVNEVIENAPVNTFCNPIAPLSNVTDPHLWSKSDVNLMIVALQQICGGISWDVPVDIWRQDAIDKFREILDEGWCNCIYIPPCCDVEYQPTSTVLHQERYPIYVVHRLDNGVCAELETPVKYKVWWINAYDELNNFQLYPNEDFAHTRTWELRLEYPSWTPSFLCTVFPANNILVASGPVLQDGTIHAYPGGWRFASGSIVEVNDRYDALDHWTARPYTYTLYGYCEPIEDKDDDCDRDD